MDCLFRAGVDSGEGGYEELLILRGSNSGSPLLLVVRLAGCCASCIRRGKI